MKVQIRPMIVREYIFLLHRQGACFIEEGRFIEIVALSDKLQLICISTSINTALHNSTLATRVAISVILSFIPIQDKA